MDRAAARDAAVWAAFRQKAVPTPVDAFAVLGFTPNAGPQTRFLTLPDANLDVLYGGAAGGSKSTSLLMYAIRSCVRYPGLQTFWFRKSFPELEQSVLELLARYNYARALGARWNSSKYVLRFPNGSYLRFAHAKNVPEAMALLSAEINLLILDERTTMPPDVVDRLYTRVRSGVPTVPCLGVRSGTNPGGIGHTRVKTDYVEATNHGAEEIAEDANGRRRIFIQARLTDTPQLDPGYARSFDGLGEQLAKAYKEGDWDVVAGMMFGEWRYDQHVVPPWTLPPSWRRIRGVDYGYAAPFAVVWAAVDNDGRLWFYRDLQRSLVIDEDQAGLIAEAEAGEHITWTPADPSMWARKGENAKSPADVYAENGVHLTPAVNDRIIGWRRIHSYLANGPACEIHRAMGWERCPMMHVFSTCADIIRLLPALPHATTGNPEDADTKADDHIPDALRYAVMSQGGDATFVIVDTPEQPNDALPAMQPLGTFAVPVPEQQMSAALGGWFDDTGDDGPRQGGVVVIP